MLFYSNQELRLTSNRMTRYELQLTLPKSTHHQRRYSPISELKNDHGSLFNEIDTVGIVINGENGSNVDGSSQQIIYLTDLRQNFVAVKFLSNVKVSINYKTMNQCL